MKCILPPILTASAILLISGTCFVNQIYGNTILDYSTATIADTSITSCEDYDFVISVDDPIKQVGGSLVVILKNNGTETITYLPDYLFQVYCWGQWLPVAYREGSEPSWNPIVLDLKPGEADRFCLNLYEDFYQNLEPGLYRFGKEIQIGGDEPKGATYYANFSIVPSDGTKSNLSRQISFLSDSSVKKDGSKFKVVLNNDSREAIGFFNPSHLEVLTQEKWVTVEYEEAPVVVEWDTRLEPGDSYEFNIHLDPSLYYPFDPGHYRVAQEIYLLEGYPRYFTVYAEFQIVT